MFNVSVFGVRRFMACVYVLLDCFYAISSIVSGHVASREILLVKKLAA